MLHRSWDDLKDLPFRFLVNVLAVSPLTPRILRWALWTVAGIQARTDNIFPRVYVRTRWLTIGRGTFINAGCHIENGARVTIGEGCSLAPGVTLLSGTHDFGPSTRRAGERRREPVVIEDGCWLGARSVVLPGVTVAKGCVIAAGAVVTRSTEPDGVYAGVPARRIRDLPP